MTEHTVAYSGKQWHTVACSGTIIQSRMHSRSNHFLSSAWAGRKGGCGHEAQAGVYSQLQAQNSDKHDCGVEGRTSMKPNFLLLENASAKTTLATFFLPAPPGGQPATGLRQAGGRPGAGRRIGAGRPLAVSLPWEQQIFGTGLTPVRKKMVQKHWVHLY